MNAIRPPKLRPGDTVGLITTSHPVSQETIERSAVYLKNLGFDVRVGKNAAKQFGFMAGRAEERAADLLEMFLSDEVRAIFCTGGGRTASQLLPLLDYDQIRQHPKIFMALSNPSIVANAITARTGLVTFHGPTGYDFGEEGVSEYTERNMLRAITSDEPLGTLQPLSSVQVLRSVLGPVRGKLYGGHLGTIRALLGTPYAPDWSGSMLLVEECFLELHDFDEELTHFKLAGVLAQISALIVGKPLDVVERTFPTDETLQDVVLRICAEYDFPILFGLDFGHTRDKLTLPLGLEAEFDSQRGELRIPQAGVV